MFVFAICVRDGLTRRYAYFSSPHRPINRFLTTIETIFSLPSRNVVGDFGCGYSLFEPVSVKSTHSVTIAYTVALSRAPMILTV